ncbi:hypothetical protein HOC98_05370 [archaeon]|nr:hypothetical protein [archaeon]
MKRLLPLLFLLLLTACTPEPTYTIEENTMTVEIQGYYQTCIEEPNIYTYNQGEWEWVNDYLPHEVEYIVDGEYQINLCDVVVCQEFTDPLQIELVEYIETEDLTYETVPLTDTLKVEITYYTNKKCTNQKIHEIIETI